MRKVRSPGAAFSRQPRHDETDDWAAVGGDPLGCDPADPASAPDAPDAPVPSSSPLSRSSLSAGGQRASRAGRPLKSAQRSLKARALEYLSRREYSRSELARKLAPFAEEQDDLDALIDSLERDGWLSDARFAESVLHRRAARMGTNRIVSELRRHALDDALIETVGAQLRETELARAQAVWRKKYGQLPQTPAERAKQARFLAARGFSHAIIVRLLKSDDDWGSE
ncbi:recombination regulator RecX [Trinickia sp.]|uniref:recombination regulator RecX n=1 Tax=Trinickia sp. TaxID=2571163 RepID=UPI0039C8E018